MKSDRVKKYDLEERTFVFAKNVIEYVRNLPKGIAYSEIGKQLVRAADSISAKIAEDFGKYHYKDRQKFGYYTRGSFEETKSWLRKGYQRKLLNDSQIQIINTYVRQIGPKLNSLINTFKNPHTYK